VSAKIVLQLSSSPDHPAHTMFAGSAGADALASELPGAAELAGDSAGLLPQPASEVVTIAVQRIEANNLFIFIFLLSFSFGALL